MSFVLRHVREDTRDYICAFQQGMLVISLVIFGFNCLLLTLPELPFFLVFGLSDVSLAMSLNLAPGAECPSGFAFPATPFNRDKNRSFSNNILHLESMIMHI